MQTNETLHELIQALAGGESGAAPDAGSATTSSAYGDAVAQNTDQLAQLRVLFQSQVEAAQENTRAITASTTASATSSGNSAAKSAIEAAGVGLLLSPILTGLLSLFGDSGSSDTAPPALTRFSLPSSTQIAASADDLSPVDFGQNGMPRTTNVSIQVSAMDSQSFLDRSVDIANAVRRAMLESSTLNDVVAEI